MYDFLILGGVLFGVLDLVEFMAAAFVVILDAFVAGLFTNPFLH